MKQNTRTYFPVLFIFAIGLFLRLYGLDKNIPPLYADETGQYYVLYKLSYFLVNPLQYLISISFSYTWIVGLTPLGARLPSAIYGSLLILFMFIFGFVASGYKKPVGIALAILTAMLPWSFMLSRIGHTHVILVVLLSIVHLFLYLRVKSIKGLVISFAPLILGVIYYPSVLFVLPFAAIPTVYHFYSLTKPEIRLKYFITLLVISTIFITYVVKRFNFFNPSARGLDMAIWRDVNTTADTDKYRGLSWNSNPDLFSFYLPPEKLANKLVYNKFTANLNIFFKNYLSFFSPDWLFLKGDTIQRHSTGQAGAFYLFLLPFMIYGAFVFFNTAQKKEKTIFLIWILASPLSAAITKDGAGYLLRAATLLPFLTYFCALGLIESFNLIKKQWRGAYSIIIFLVAAYSTYSFFYSYFHVYPATSARSFEYGFKELSDFQVQQDGASMLVVWDGYYHNNDFRFWQQTPFDEYRKFTIKPISVGSTVFYQTFANLYFAKLQTTSDLVDFLKQYHPQYLVLPDRFFYNYPLDIDIKLGPANETIYYPDKTAALRIYVVNQQTISLLEK